MSYKVPEFDGEIDCEKCKFSSEIEEDRCRKKVQMQMFYEGSLVGDDFAVGGLGVGVILTGVKEAVAASHVSKLHPVAGAITIGLAVEAGVNLGCDI